MSNNKTRKFSYILVTFLLPIVLAFIAHSTSFFDSRPKLNHGILLTGSQPFVVNIDKTADESQPKWHIIVIPENPAQAENIIKIAQTSIKLLGEKSERVKVAMEHPPTQLPIAKDIKTIQSPHNLPSILHAALRDNPQALKGDLMLISDPMGQVITLYNNSLRLDSLLQDLKRLLKYSRIG